jgi:hypothetical protein
MRTSKERSSKTVCEWGRAREEGRARKEGGIGAGGLQDTKEERSRLRLLPYHAEVVDELEKDGFQSYEIK